MKNILKILKKYSAMPVLNIYSLLMGICLTITACDSFTEVDFPQSELTSAAVFNDAASVHAAFANIYSKLRDNVLITGQTNGLHVVMGLYADELDYYGVPGEDAETFYRHSILASNTEVASIWNDTYNLVYATNSILEGVQNSKELSETEKNAFMGETLFIRAYLHFHLLQLFGPVPYITTTDYRVNKDVKRLPENEVYPILVQDLLDAKTLLTGQVSNSRTRPTTQAANALLARTYLYQQNYTAASAVASELINDGSLNLGDTTEMVFTTNSTSTIWQLKPEAGNPTWEALTFIFEETPAFVALNPELVASFEAEDSRRPQWIGEVAVGNELYYYPNKYKTREGSGDEYSILLRLAEQFLIRAEARLYLGDLSGAKEDLNRIRSRAGLDPTVANTVESLKIALENERRHELFTEQGHRWFDLKRTQRAAEVIGPIKPNWKATDVLFPIPEMELNLNPKLEPQNPGY